MKIIFILLLGFGGTYPLVCGKKQNKNKQESELKTKQNIQTQQKTFTNATKQNNWTATNYL
jgi:hypothetical protein